MNDLPLYIDSSLDMYTDESTIDATGETIEELESKLNIDFKNVQIWCQKNTYQKETKLQRSEIKGNFNNTMLENVNSEKLCGVIIDKQLSWKHHIDKTAKTFSKIIALLT